MCVGPSETPHIYLPLYQCQAFDPGVGRETRAGYFSLVLLGGDARLGAEAFRVSEDLYASLSKRQQGRDKPTLGCAEQIPRHPSFLAVETSREPLSPRNP